MEKRIDSYIRQTCPVFGLPPYWWRLEGMVNAHVQRLPRSRYLVHPKTLQTEEWERVHCFATIIGKVCSQWIARKEFCRVAVASSCCHSRYMNYWRNLPYDVRRIYLGLGGDSGNEFRKQELNPWMKTKYSGIF